MKKVLITTDEVVFHAPTKHTLDPRSIQHSIIVAEERFIRPALGLDFYTALVEAKNVVITVANKDAKQDEINASLPPGSQQVELQVGDIINAWEYLSDDNQALWKEQLWKLTAEAVMLLALPEGFVQFGSEGTVHMQPPAGPINNTSVVSPELKSVRWMMDKKLADRIDPLREAMHLWLCMKKKADSTKYSLYTKACDCDIDGVAYKRKSDMIFDIYGDENNPNCCE